MKQALGRGYETSGSIVHELQDGTSLIWLVHPPTWTESDAEREGRALIERFLPEMPAIMALAESASRRRFPGFWQEHDQLDLPGRRLAVWGVRLDVATGLVAFDVGENHDFFWKHEWAYAVLDVHQEERLPVPPYPDEHLVFVSGVPGQGWQVRSS